MGSGIIQAFGTEFFEGYCFATQTNPDDVPFAKLQDFDFKDSLSLKELMGPEGLTAQSVGASERKLTAAVTDMTINLSKYYRMRGGSAPVAITPIVNPAVAPTLTAGAGSTALTIGYVAVAFSYVSPYGETLISPIQTVSVTAGQQIAVTALGALPSGVSNVNWYVSTQSYSTAPLAAAATLYLAVNNAGTAFNITAYSANTAKTIPTSTSLGLSRSVYSMMQTDVPTPFQVHLKNPVDGSGREFLFKQVVCPDLDSAMKLRDWTTQKYTFNIYADPTTGKICDVLGVL